MKKENINGLGLGIIIGAVLTLSTIGIMASKPAPVASSSFLTFVTSRDGIRIYKIGDCYVAKTDDGVSITK